MTEHGPEHGPAKQVNLLNGQVETTEGIISLD